jgi:hypothetical protein
MRIERTKTKHGVPEAETVPLVIRFPFNLMILSQNRNRVSSFYLKSRFWVPQKMIILLVTHQQQASNQDIAIKAPQTVFCAESTVLSIDPIETSESALRGLKRLTFENGRFHSCESRRSPSGSNHAGWPCRGLGELSRPRLPWLNDLPQESARPKKGQLRREICTESQNAFFASKSLPRPNSNLK